MKRKQSDKMKGGKQDCLPAPDLPDSKTEGEIKWQRRIESIKRKQRKPGESGKPAESDKPGESGILGESDNS